MNSMEKSMLLDELFALRKADKEERDRLLTHLAFNDFVLNVPYYREMYRLSDHKMSLSRMTLVNWLAKGATFTSTLIERLKDWAMIKDSIVNCDETWCKVKMNRHFLKKYV